MKKSFRFLLTAALAALSLWPAAADDLRAMAWNLEDMDLFDGNGSSRVEWQAEAEENIAAAIRGINPDLCFIAEAPSLIELRSFVERHHLGYEVLHLRQQSGRRDFADGMALLHRMPVVSASLETPPIPGSGRGSSSAYLDWSYRGLLVVEIDAFTIIGVHLKSPWDGKRRSYEIRESQVRGLLDFIESIDGKLIVLGDFNDSPGRDEMESSFGLPDTLALLEGELVRSPGYGDTQEKGYNLDHIFVRGAGIGDRHVEDTDWSLSDHRPVWADIHY